MPIVLLAVIVAGVALARAIHGGSWRLGGWAARVHLSIGWALASLGVVHICATPLIYSKLSGAALWFASGGIAMCLGGLLNVLQRLYVASAPGLSLVSIAGNVALTVLAVTFVALAGARVVREPQFALLLGLLLTTTVLSMRAVNTPDVL